MASLLGSLRVRLTAETEDFRRGLDGARTKLGSFQKEFGKLQSSTIAQVASFGVLVSVIKQSMTVANEYDKAQRQLGATAKLTGVSVGFLSKVSEDAQSTFKLSAISANGFAIEMTKLAGKAGDVGKASSGLSAFLDIGAARGLSAAETLKAVQQSILGIDEGTDKLFGKNPSVIYAEFASKIHTTAGRLTDQQKAQALLNAAMEDGAKVRGEYQKWLGTSQGQQYLLSQGMDQTMAVLGKALQPAMVAIIPVMTTMAIGVQNLIKGFQMLGADLRAIPGFLKAAKPALTGNFAEARAQVKATADEWKKSVNEIVNPPKVEFSAALDTPKPSAMKTAAATVAKKFSDSLEAEWENLRHTVNLTSLEVGGTDSARLAAEEQHALKLLDIERQHVESRRKLKELNEAEYQDELRRLGIKRQLAMATRTEMDAAQQRNAAARASQDAKSITTNDQLERVRIFGDAALSRVDNRGGGIRERLAAQLSIVEQTYQIQRQALLDDKQLSGDQLTNELRKLDLARERQRIQLRISAASDEEAKAADKQADAAARKKGLKLDAMDIGAGALAGVIGGQGLDMRGLGGSVGALAGTALGVPGASTILGAVGSALGGLFGKKDDARPERIISSLEAIAFNTAGTITAIEQQTDQLLTPERQLMNLPTNFSVPNYRPVSGGGGGSVTNVRNQYDVRVSVSVETKGNPGDVEREVERAVANAIRDGRTLSPRGRRFL